MSAPRAALARRRRRWRSGRATTKRAPPCGDAGSTQRAAAVLLDDVAHDRQADAAAALSPARPPALEGAPDLLALAAGTPGPSSRDARSRPRRRARERDAHRLPGRPVLHRVVEQIEQDVAQRLGAHRAARPGRSRRRRARAATRRAAGTPRRCARLVADVASARAPSVSSRAEAGEAQHVLDEVRSRVVSRSMWPSDHSRCSRSWRGRGGASRDRAGSARAACAARARRSRRSRRAAAPARPRAGSARRRRRPAPRRGRAVRGGREGATRGSAADDERSRNFRSNDRVDAEGAGAAGRSMCASSGDVESGRGVEERCARSGRARARRATSRLRRPFVNVAGRRPPPSSTPESSCADRLRRVARAVHHGVAPRRRHQRVRARSGPSPVSPTTSV